MSLSPFRGPFFGSRAKELFGNQRYDDQGRIKLAYDQAGNRGFAYQVDGEGRILQRDELIGGQVDAQGNARYFLRVAPIWAK